MHSTAQHSTAQHSTAQHSTAQHSTAQHSTAQDVEKTHAMLSVSDAHAPTALVTLTRRAWLVLVSRFTRDGIPPALRIAVLLA